VLTTQGRRRPALGSAKGCNVTLLRSWWLRVMMGITVILFAVLFCRFDVARVMNVLSDGSVLSFATATIVLAGTNPFNASAMAHHSGRPSRHRARGAAQDPVCRLVFQPGPADGRRRRCRTGLALSPAWRDGFGYTQRAARPGVCGFAVLMALYLATLHDLLSIVREPVQQRMLLLILAGSIAGLVAFRIFDRLPYRLAAAPTDRDSRYIRSHSECRAISGCKLGSTTESAF
jgi:hypothetical protein